MPQNIDDIENRDLLVRLDERTDSIKKDLTNIRSDIVDLKNETKQRLTTFVETLCFGLV